MLTFDGARVLTDDILQSSWCTRNSIENFKSYNKLVVFINKQFPKPSYQISVETEDYYKYKDGRYVIDD